MTWKEICADPILANIPHRVESDKWGHPVLSPPPSFEHARYQSEITFQLRRLMGAGTAVSECPVRTAEGVKAADVAWISRQRLEQHPITSDVCVVAPEICVEVRSPSNSKREIMEKFDLYFSKGAKECWLCEKNGSMTFFNPEGKVARSVLCPEFPVKIFLDT